MNHHIYARAAKAAAVRRHSGRRGASIFAGDPVEITQEAAAAVTDPAQAQTIIDATVADAASDQLAAERVAAFDAMSPTMRADVVVVPALLVSNGTITQNPVTRAIASSILNYNYLRCLTDYASAGLVKSVYGAAAPAATVLTLTDTDLPQDEVGLKSIPILKFTLSAGVLNARPGAQYTVTAAGQSVSNQTFSTQKYSFARIDYVQAVMGYFIPFQILQTRTIPVLAMYGSTGGDTPTPVPFTFTVEGMAETEQLTVTIPGYSISETRDIAELYALPAGYLVR